MENLKESKLLVILLGGAIILGIVLGVITVMNKETSAPPTNNEWQPPEDWETYTATVMNYQVSYPSYWDAVVEEDSTFLNIVKFSDPSGQVKNYAQFFSGRTTGRDTFGFSCMEKIDKEIIIVGGISADKQIFKTRGGTYRIPDGDKDLPCRDPLGAYAVSVDFAINSTGDPVVDYANPQYREYSFEFYIFDNNLELVDKILSTFRFLR